MNELSSDALSLSSVDLPGLWVAALAADPAVADCAVRAREQAGAAAHVVFVVPRAPLSVTALRRRLAAQLGEERLPDAIALVTALPRTPEGAVDHEALRSLPVVDDDLARRWEAAIGRVPGVRRAAAVIEPRRSRDTWRSMAELLPEAAAPSRSAPSSLPAGAAGTRVTRRRAMSDGGPLAEGTADGTLVDRLVRAAEGSRGYVHVLADGTERSVSYREVLAEARRVCGGLRAQGLRPGDRALLQLDRSDELFAAFWGCVIGGMVPVPLAVPPGYAQPSPALSKLMTAWSMLGRPHIIAGAQAAEVRRLAASADPQDPPLVCHALEELAAHAPVEAPRTAAADEITLLLLTSGSTGKPKVVPLTHRNLLSMSAGTIQANDFSSADVTLNWMPLDHVGALSFLGVMAVDLGCTQVHASNAWVAGDPVRWLDLIEAHRATISWAPNFAFRLLVERAADVGARRRDLSSMRFMVNAGEANVARTMRAFLEAMAPHGLRPDALHPAFGMSETCSGITWSKGFGAGGEDGEEARFVELGPPIPGAAIRIVGADGRVLDEGEIGGLQLRGPSVFSGYLHQEDGRAAFQDGWFTTGDLGYLSGGRLVLTGREKDDIVIHGVNHHAHEIESIVEQVEGVEVSFTAACAARDPDGEGERLAVFFHPKGGEADPALLRRIAGAVARAVGAAPGILVPLPREMVPKTSIGKVQRGELRRRLEAGELAGLVRRPGDEAGGAPHQVPDWYFRRAFVRRAAPSASGAAARALVFDDGAGLADALCALRPGLPTVRVRRGAELVRLGPDRFQIARPDREQLRRLFEMLAASDLLPDEIVDLSAFDPGAEMKADADSATVVGASVDRLGAVLDLLHAWSAAAGERDVTLRVVSSGALAAVPGDALSVDKSGLGALLRTAAAEHGWLRCQHIDVRAGSEADAARSLALELGAPPLDETVALRAGERLVPQLEEVTFSPLDRAPDEQGRAYLVTGGLGKIGRALCRDLIERRGARVLIVGRAAEDAAGPALAALPPGAARYEQVDVADAGAVEAAVARAEAAWGAPLDGVFHLAAVGREQPLLTETREGLAEALRPKLGGAVAIAGLARSRPGLSLVSFSSVNGAFGGFGAGAYSAASAALDELSAWQRSAGLRAACFAWSLWDLGSAGAREGGAGAARARGFRAVSTDRGLFSLRLGLAHDVPQLFVGLDAGSPPVRARLSAPAAPADTVAAYIEADAGAEPEAAIAALAITDRFGRATSCDVVALPALPLLPSGEVARDELGRDAGARRAPPRDDWERAIAAIWSDLLEASAFGVEDSFFEVGGQSLTAARLLARLRAAFGVDVSMSQLFAEPTIAALARLVAGASSEPAGPALPPITRAPRAARHPLSLAQRRLWILDRLDESGRTHNEALTMTLDGPVDAGLLGEALRCVIARHEILRTRFPVEDGDVAQVIDAPPLAGPLAVTDLAALAPAERDAELRRRTGALAAARFDLARGPLLRAELFRLGPRSSVLALALHHIITDAWSIRILMRDWSAAYRDLLSGGAGALPEPALQYVDFAAWQRASLTDDVLSSQLSRWRGALEGAPPLLSLPLVRPRPPSPSHRGARLPLRLSKDLADALRALARETGATLYMVLMAAFAAMLSRYSGQRDIVVGSAMQGRGRSELEELMGFFVSTLALRVGVEEAATMRSLIGAVRAAALDAFAHQDVPFDRLVEALRPDRNPGYHPIVQVVLELQDRPLSHLEIEGVEARTRAHDSGAVLLDLELHLHEAAGALEGHIAYAVDLFDEPAIARLASSYERLLAGAAGEPDRPLSSVELVDPAERARIMEWSRRGGALAERSVLAEIADHAARRPSAPALSFRGERLTYGEMWERAGRLAARLSALGVGAEVPVMQILDRSIEMIVGLLAIFRAGGVYVPIEPSLPPARVAALVDEIQPPVVLTRRSLEGELPAFMGHVALADDDPPAGGAELAPVEPRPSDAAYILFTSGSTGRPKGVVLEHGGFANMVRAVVSGVGIRPDDRAVQFASSGFDASLFEIFTALAAGASLVMIPAEVQADPAALIRTIAEERVTVATLPPSYVRLMGRRDLSPLRVLITAGEAADVEDARRHARSLACFNAYGPTEASVCASFHRASAEEPYPFGVPLGGPIAGTEMWILDGDAPAPIGVPGEICLGGVGLARGYYNDPERTRASFVPHPLKPGERLYRTGDVGRWRDDGVVLYVGRKDDEVKVRGHRVAPGEVERALLAHPQVAEACVAGRREADGSVGLVGWYAAAEGAELEHAELREHLAARLPHYMIPARLVRVDKLPVNAHGKINRAALPDPDAAPLPLAAAEAPRDQMETLVAGVWRDVLHLDQVGLRDNFFDVGGHSLRMVQVQQALEALLGAAPSLVEMFQHPTVESLAAFLSRRDGASAPQDAAASRAPRAARSGAVDDQLDVRRAHRRAQRA